MYYTIKIMKLRQHKPLNNEHHRCRAFGQLTILIDGLNKARRAIFGKHATPVAARAQMDAVNSVEWPLKPHNRSPKRSARLKHSLTVLMLKNA